MSRPDKTTHETKPHDTTDDTAVANRRVESESTRAAEGSESDEEAAADGAAAAELADAGVDDNDAVDDCAAAPKERLWRAPRPLPSS